MIEMSEEMFDTDEMAHAFEASTTSTDKQFYQVSWQLVERFSRLACSNTHPHKNY